MWKFASGARVCALVLVAAAPALARADAPSRETLPDRIVSVDSLWVRGNGDVTSSPPAGAELSLDWVERTVLERNPTLAAARAAASAAEAAARAARGLEPLRVAGLVAPRTLGGYDAELPGGMGTMRAEAAWSVSASQRLPLFGRRGAAGSAARGEALAAGEAREATRLDLLYEARAAFYEDWRLARELETNRELVTLVSATRSAALARYGAGLAPQADPLRAEVELARLDHDRAMIERDQRIVRARLAALLHAPPRAELPPAPAFLPHLAITAGEDVERAPEVRAAGAMLDASRAMLALAGRERLPELELEARYDRFMADPEMRFAAGLSMELPTWLGGAAANERSARALVARAEAERAAAVAESARRRTEARARLEDARHELAILVERVVPASEAAQRAALAAYEAGRLEFGALIATTREWAEARLDRSRAEADERLAEAAVARASSNDARPVRLEEEER